MIKLSALAILATVVTAAPLANFNAGGFNPSPACQAAIVGIISNPEISTCLNVQGLSVFEGISPDASLIQPIDTWLNGVCAAQPCSDAAIQALATNITSGCATDFQNAGIPQSALPEIQQAIRTWYPVERKIACLKTSATNTLCVTSTLRDIENFIQQPLSINHLMTHLMSQGFDLGQLPPNVICTDCTQAAYSILKQDLPTIVTPQVDSAVQQKCGANFVNGGVPPGITRLRV